MIWTFKRKFEIKPDFSRYISQVSLHLLSEQKPFTNNDYIATVKPTNLHHNLFQSPKFQNISNPNEILNSTILSKSTQEGKHRRSKSKITKVVSRK